MPAGTNQIEVHEGRLRVRCIACGTTSKAPASGRLGVTGQDLCRFGCYEIMSDSGGIYWNARDQRYHVTDATIDRLVEAHKLVAICFYQWPGGLTPQLTKNYDFPHG